MPATAPAASSTLDAVDHMIDTETNGHGRESRGKQKLLKEAFIVPPRM